ncbi:MAG: CBS domain-containing protein [Chloroflexi bacterium]|nr:CBS domain-containing protein [Chloroflexota bacterium]
MKIDEVLATKGGNVFTTQPNESIKNAVAILSKHNIGALVVVDDSHHVIGILSERDIVRQASRDDRFLSRTVRELMTPKVITGSPHDDLEIVMRTMTKNHFRHLPIVENDRLVGIVALGDLVKARLDHYIGEIENLQSQLM